jgi:glucokinase
MTVLGVDIGATKIATGRVNERAQITEPRTTPTRAAEGVDVSLAQVWRAIEGSLTSEVEAIGICAPGPLNPKTGVVVNPPNLPGWRDVPLAQMASEKFGLPARLENDCNAAGLAEARYGAARGYNSVFYAAIGTGIGSGIILDGKIYHGKNGAAAEGGHVTIDYRSSAICGCGTPGCIEALASGYALERMGRYDLDEIATRLAAWLGGVVSLLDPDIIVLGGGVMGIGEPLFARLRAMVPKRTVNPYASETPIVPAQFGAEAGVVGAAAVVLAGSRSLPQSADHP